MEIDCVNFKNLGSKSWKEPIDSGKFWEVGQELKTSFEKIGFAYITNHGIPQHLINRVFNVGSIFFSLPLEKKLLYKRSFTNFQGYVEIDQEKLHSTGSVPEFRESFDVVDPSLAFPNDVDGFQEAVKKLTDFTLNLCLQILKCLEMTLDLPPGTLTSKHSKVFSEDNWTTFRIVHYPPIPDSAGNDSIRCGEHSDYGTITVLFQDQIGGLEVSNGNDEWISARPIPGAVLVNVGDLLEIWTGGLFKATVHRILAPHEEWRRRSSRRSQVFFLNPDNDVVVNPLFGSTSYQPTNAKQYINNLYNKNYNF